MKNTRKLFVLTVMMLVPSLTLNAQALIDRSTNAPRECDTILRVPVAYMPASITFLVCNAMGITYITATDHQPAGDGYSADIDCSALLNGTYLLYINCNGQVYSETFKKQ